MSKTGRRDQGRLILLAISLGWKVNRLPSGDFILKHPNGNLMTLPRSISKQSRSYANFLSRVKNGAR